MKRKIISVEMNSGLPKTWPGIDIIKVYRTGEPGRTTYPLTEKNFWRAVGLQLHLAAFPTPAPADGRAAVTDEGERTTFHAGDAGYDGSPETAQVGADGALVF